MPIRLEFSALSLAFRDPELERQFEEDLGITIRNQFRAAWVGAVIVIASVAFLDPKVIPGYQLRDVYLARYGIDVPVVGALLLFSFFAPQPLFTRWYQWLGGLAALAVQVATAAIVWVTTPVGSDGFHHACIATVLTILATHYVGGLRFWVSTVFSTIGGAQMLFALSRTPHHLLWYAAHWFLAANLLGMIGGYLLERYRRVDFIQRRAIAEEKAKSEALLRNILPESIAERLKDEHHTLIADAFDEATILFADIVGFTALSARLKPPELVGILNRLFTAFDELAEKLQLEKIKTIGDAYMVVSGVPKTRDDQVSAVVEMGFLMRDAVAKVSAEAAVPLDIRIGIHTGPVVAGVIGTKKFAYDLWGDAVNTASRMESHGLPGCIQVSDAVHQRLGNRYVLEPRGEIGIKGKGTMKTWLVQRRAS